MNRLYAIYLYDPIFSKLIKRLTACKSTGFYDSIAYELDINSWKYFKYMYFISIIHSRKETNSYMKTTFQKGKKRYVDGWMDG